MQCGEKVAALQNQRVPFAVTTTQFPFSRPFSDAVTPRWKMQSLTLLRAFEIPGLQPGTGSEKGLQGGNNHVRNLRGPHLGKGKFSARK